MKCELCSLQRYGKSRLCLACQETILRLDRIVHGGPYNQPLTTILVYDSFVNVRKADGKGGAK